MKYGIRKPSIKKRLKAKTTGKLKRKINKTINPFYGKKGIGFIKNPTKSIKSHFYHKNTFSIDNTIKYNNSKINYNVLNKNYDSLRRIKFYFISYFLLSFLFLIMSLFVMPLIIISIVFFLLGCKNYIFYKKNKNG